VNGGFTSLAEIHFPLHSIRNGMFAKPQGNEEIYQGFEMDEFGSVEVCSKSGEKIPKQTA
jgi:hypothetical protein